MRVVTSAEMRAIEQEAARDEISLGDVMERAGEAVAAAAARHGGPVLVLVGPGNNGGDGVIAARRLEAWGIATRVYGYKRSPHGEGLSWVCGEDDGTGEILTKLASRSAVIVDALFGTGQNRPPDPSLAAILHIVNDQPTPYRIAVDLPTGVSADTGAVPDIAFRADETICMALPKIGDVVFPGAGFAGRIEIAEVGLPLPGGEDKVTQPDDADIAAMLPIRDLDSNKGSAGRVLFSGGSRDFQGAPALSAIASYRSGAGLVELGVIETVQRSAATHVMEVVYSVLPERDGRISPDAAATIAERLDRADAFVFGPGMGLSADTVQLTGELLPHLRSTKLHGCVVDADGLNALAEIDDWWRGRERLVVTPHPGEMSRLTGLSITEIQSDRLSVARVHAEQWGVVVVLKGAGTIVAAPDGRVSINPTGGPNLATAGTGDVLSGIIGGLLAQGCDPYRAAVAGSYLHGRAGDIVRKRFGAAGTLAGDLLPVIPEARREIMEKAGRRG